MTTGTAGGLTWSLRDRSPEDLTMLADTVPDLPADPSAWSDGAGVRVCVVDTGVECGHPSVGAVQGSYEVTSAPDGTLHVVDSGPLPDSAGDGCGHGTACAGIVRRVAPDCELYSVRVLGEGFTGTGEALLTGLRWAVDQGFDVVNLSLSTTRPKFLETLRTLADQAFFTGTTLVASAHNTPVESFPWRFSSVISVGTHREDDSGLFLYNPAPPVEFFAPGQNVQVAWTGGKTIRTTGNSFATPFISGMCARLLGTHPKLTPFQIKHALYLSAANVRIGEPGTRGES